MTADRTRHVVDPTSDSPPNSRRWAVLAVLCFSLFLAGVDLTVLHIAAPSLAADLRPSNTSLLWILDAYSLTVAALLVTFGTLSDKLGRKKIVLTGFIVFGVASLACALSTSAAQLIPARIILGIGTAMIMASTVSIIRVVFTDSKERTFAIGLWTAAHSLGASLGPVVGGFLVEHFWWGSVFLVNVPIVLIVTVVGVAVIPESKNPVPRTWDAISAIASIIALGFIVYSIKSVGSELKIDTVAIVFAVVGILFLVLFVRRQLRIPEPLLDLRLFSDRRFSVAAFCVLICFGSYTAMLYFLAQWFQYVGNYSSLRAGLALTPLALANAAGAALASRASSLVGLRWSITAGLSTAGIGLILLNLVADLDAYPTLIPTLLMVGAGAGIIMTLGADAIMTAASPDRAGEAAAIQETSFELGAGLGIAVLGTALAIAYRLSLTLPEGTALQGNSDPTAILASTVKPVPEVVESAVKAYDVAIHTVSYIAAAALLASAALACLLLRFDTDRKSDAIGADGVN